MRFALMALLMLTSCTTLADVTPTWTPGDSPAFHRPIEQLAGLKMPSDWMTKVVFEAFDDVSVALPPAFDWRKVGPGLSPVRDQLTCNSCWAFSTAASMEDMLKLTSVPSAQSQQYLISCNTLGYTCRSGGWFDSADMYVTKGAVSSEQFPYAVSDAPCKQGLKYGEKLISWSYVKSDTAVPDTLDIKKAIYLYGPVSAGVYATSAMQSYKSGIFNTCGTGSVNHAINIVGWDDKTGSWIMRNSWGESWGENGYMRIKYGCNKIGLGANFYKFRVEPLHDQNSETPTCVLSAKPTMIMPGGSSVLTVSGANGAEAAKIEGQTVPVEGGSITVTPTVGTQYEAIVTGAKGEGRCSAKVDIVPPCQPVAEARGGGDATVGRREKHTMGSPAIPGTKYLWTSETSDSTWTDAQWTFRTPKAGVYVYNLKATTSCGSAEDKVTITVK